MSARTFISHASDDASSARALCDALEQGRRTCWIAPRDVTVGAPFAGEIAAALRSAPSLLLLLSAAACRSKYVLREVDLAASLHVPIVVARLEEIRPSDDLAFYIGSEHWVDALSAPIAAHVDAVESALRNAEARHAGASSAAPRERWVPPRERVLAELSADVARYQDLTFKLKAVLEEASEVLVRDAAAQKTLLGATLAYNAFAPGLVERMARYRAAIRKYWGAAELPGFDRLHAVLETGVYRGALFGLNPVRARLNQLAAAPAMDVQGCQELDALKTAPLRVLQERLDELARTAREVLGALERSG